jgi:hypothetical protein
VLASASRDRELFFGIILSCTGIEGKGRFGGTPKPARETRALPGRSLIRDRAFRTWQMGDAIFLAVARNAEIEVWIGQFGRPADRAFVEWLSFTTRLLGVPLPAR